MCVLLDPKIQIFESCNSAQVFAKDFPHSKQNRPDRGVISLQNGHILCDPTR
jgi:hypothetical protein